MKRTYQDWKGSESFENGLKIEGSFGDILKRKYPETRPATRDEQFKHIDFVCNKGSIDVKAMKSVSRGSKIQYNYIWLEFKNKVGDNGWLYGEQDYIAFEFPEQYLIVRRTDLAELAECLCDVTDMVGHASLALYKGYTRRNMQDLLSMITSEDLISIKPMHLNKDA